MRDVVSGRSRTWILSSVVACGAATLGLMPAPLWGADGGSKHGAVVLPKQPVGQPDPHLLPLWAAFEGQATGKVSVFWHPRWGSPETVYGRLSAPMTPSESAARRFLADHAQLFKLNPTLQDLTLDREIPTLIGRQFVFVQHHRGVSVQDGELKVLFNQEGRISAVNNSYVPLSQTLDATPAISADEAVAAGRRDIEQLHGALPPGEDLPSPVATLVIYAEEGTPTLAWQVIHHSWGPTWEVFLDAKTGRTLKSAVDINRYVKNSSLAATSYNQTGKGQVFVTNAVVQMGNPNLRDNDDSSSLLDISNSSLITPRYTKKDLARLSSSGYLDGKWASSSASQNRAYSANRQFIFDRSVNGFSETMGYYYIDLAQQRIQSLGFTNINARQQVFSIDRYSVDNSYYSVSSKQITYGYGGVDDAEDAELIWHEYGHAIQDNIVPGFGTTAESGAMGEGFGDYWAGTMGYDDNKVSLGKTPIPEWVCLAEWDSTTYRTPLQTGDPTCLRRLDGTKHYPEDMVKEVHDDGEIWSAALWQIRGALGADKADRVILQHHFLLKKNASFNQASLAFVTTACNLNYQPSEVSAISSILRDRGFDKNGGNAIPGTCP